MKDDFIAAAKKGSNVQRQRPERQALVEEADAGGPAEAAERADDEVAAPSARRRRTAVDAEQQRRPSEVRPQQHASVAGIRRAAMPPQKSPMP